MNPYALTVFLAAVANAAPQEGPGPVGPVGPVGPGQLGPVGPAVGPDGPLGLGPVAVDGPVGPVLPVDGPLGAFDAGVSPVDQAIADSSVSYAYGREYG